MLSSAISHDDGDDDDESNLQWIFDLRAHMFSNQLKSNLVMYNL